MRSYASIKGHPIHPMLVSLPIGLWVFSFVADLIVVAGNAAWVGVAYYTMAGGLIGALLAAVFGFIDLLTITTGRARSIGVAHLLLNLTVVVLFAINWWLRSASVPPPTGLVWLSALSVMLLAISGWLGGEMVFRHGVGVNTDARR